MVSVFTPQGEDQSVTNRQPGVEYLEFFAFVCRSIQPTSYFEIGTHLGRSLAAFDCKAICVDPEFKLETLSLLNRPETHFYQQTSDAYFAQHNPKTLFPKGPDICFLDGMHRCEYLLRDFMNAEKICHDRSIIFMHDCLPFNLRMAARRYELGGEEEGPSRAAWTGDVWKVVPILRKYRPDLRLQVIDCLPTGLVAISNLNASSTSLRDNYSSILSELHQMTLDELGLETLRSDARIVSSRYLIDNPELLTLFLDIR